MGDLVLSCLTELSLVIQYTHGQSEDMVSIYVCIISKLHKLTCAV